MNPDSVGGNGLENWHVVPVEAGIHFFDSHQVTEISLVELDDMGKLVQIDPLQRKVLLEVAEAVLVRPAHRLL